MPLEWQTWSPKDLEQKKHVREHEGGTSTTRPSTYPYDLQSLGGMFIELMLNAPDLSLIGRQYSNNYKRLLLRTITSHPLALLEVYEPL